MLVVTGGAGFIGSQLISGLNKIGIDNILVIDDLNDGTKFSNLAINKIADYMDKSEFRCLLHERHDLCKKIELIFHQGACSTTTEWDGQYMMDNNYTYSKELLDLAIEKTVPFIYASSAAVYGVNTNFSERSENEAPINVYAYSKLLFDNYVRSISPEIKSQIVGLRYFNVYGAREAHKKNMASVAYHLNNQLLDNAEVRLFEGSHGYSDGEQLRDFIFVDDVVDVNLWMLQNPAVSGIYNVGTGSANTFNSVANAIIEWHNKGKIRYIPFPESLKKSYQSFTEADIADLRRAGYNKEFTPLEKGISAYMEYLNPKK